jgi:hypothetical protein
MTLFFWNSGEGEIMEFHKHIYICIISIYIYINIYIYLFIYIMDVMPPLHPYII